jgi:hypothetical protein
MLVYHDLCESGAQLNQMVYDICNMGSLHNNILERKQNRHYNISICLLGVSATCFGPYIASSSGYDNTSISS